MKRIDRMFLIAHLTDWESMHVSKQKPERKEILTMLTLLSTKVLNFGNKVSLKKNNKNIYCILIQDFFIFKEYLFDQTLLFEKNLVFMKYFSNLIHDYVGNCNVSYENENNNLIFYLHEKNTENIGKV